MAEYFKFPKILHLQWSEHVTTDDKFLGNISVLASNDIVVTEKLDGECTTMYPDHFHARSLDSRHHLSRDYVKGIWGRIKFLLPQGWRVCGENMYAKHSIFYTALTDYFYVFEIYNEDNVCLSWDDTMIHAAIWGLKTVPQLYRGPWDEAKIRGCFDESEFGREQEGYVVRSSRAFHFDLHSLNSAKFVRKGHVQTSQFWMNEPIQPNLVI